MTWRAAAPGAEAGIESGANTMAELETEKSIEELLAEERF